jgi:hypothetical protein
MIAISLLLLTFLALQLANLPQGVQSQNMRGGQRRNRKKQQRQRPLVNTAGSLASDGNQLMRALTINYPLHIFDGKHQDWRTAAKYSEELVASSEAERSWTEVSQAQDQEDIWLYENWFYGMAGGVIMESGALNGILFSNSFMFESFANWTAIHVGE